VQFHRFYSAFYRGVYLAFQRIDKQAGLGSGGTQLFDRFPDARKLRAGVKAALGGNFFSFLGH